jgi:hypothetical protein
MEDRELLVAEDLKPHRQLIPQNVGAAWMATEIVTPEEPASGRGGRDWLQEEQAVRDHTPQLVEHSAQLTVAEVVGHSNGKRPVHRAVPQGHPSRVAEDRGRA